MDYVLEAGKQAKEDPSEDKDALRMLNDGHFLGILIDVFLGKLPPPRFISSKLDSSQQTYSIWRLLPSPQFIMVEYNPSPASIH